MHTLLCYSPVGVSAAAAMAAASSGRDMQRCMPYGLPGLPPGHPGMDPFLRMPGVYPPGSREALVLINICFYHKWC